MNLPTTQFAIPAAPPRTGRAPIALPGDEGLDRLLADPRLGSTAKTIALALVKHWAWSKPSCWPSDRTIAAKVAKSPGHVQRCLRELEAAGWIVREHTDEVPPGRRIWLAWRGTPGTGAAGGPAPAREGLPAPARSKRDVVVKGRMEPGESEVSLRQRPEAEAIPPVIPSLAPVDVVEVPPVIEPEPLAGPIPNDDVEHTPRESASSQAIVASPPSPAPLPCVPLTPEQQARLAEMPPSSRDQVLLWLMTGDMILVAEARKRLAPLRPVPARPQTLAEVLGRIREDPSFPALAADWLAKAFGDWKSYSGFKARCEEAWRGERPVEQLVEAYCQATGPKARNPGAVFMHVLKIG